MLAKTNVFTIVVVALLAATSFSEVPQSINYQGRVTDASGQPLTGSSQILKFSIYDAPTGGALLWNSGLRQITIQDGLFSYNLGDSTALPPSLFIAQTALYLGVQVGTDPENLPRAKFRAVPYAYEAVIADSSGFASVTADDAVNSAKIQDGTIQLADIGQNGASVGQIMKWNGAAWEVANDSSTNGTKAWANDGSVVRLETSSDSVGIGTVSPSEKLEVNGNVLINGNATIGSSNTNTGTYSFVAGQ